MVSKIVASYEVLAQPLAPVPNVPFVQQGAFIQISNITTHSALIDIEYVGTPKFVATSGPLFLATNYITQTGLANLTSYPVATFLAAPFVGFKDLTIPAGDTWLFGVQYLLTPGMTPPTTGVDARGFIELKAAAGSKLLVLATTRQVFNNYSGATLLDIAESAYAVPLATGPEVSF
jgi:hypothetical protein